MKSGKIILLIFLFLGILSLYKYCYVSEHQFFFDTQNSLKATDNITTTFTLKGVCKAINYDTFVPYIIVKENDFEVISIALNNGYDTLLDCMKVNVDKFKVNDLEDTIQVFMKNGQIKEIKLIHSFGGR
jgi:hypothetical protein